MVDLMVQGDEEVTNWIRRSKIIRSLTKLPGDASTRSYYRVHAADDRTYIIMRMEPFLDQGLRLPFLKVRDHLANSGIDVPEVLDVDPERGFVLLEDLGDVTLLRHLQEVSNSDVERKLYERVIDSLIDLQLRASRGKGEEFSALQIRFDREKLMWEMGFTIEHFYKIYLKREILKSDHDAMMTGFEEICSFLADQPTVLAHRDFHSRNIMVTPDKKEPSKPRLVMIDFQDARMGPCQYDLASLLRDSYYQLEENQISKLLDYYISKWREETGQSLSREEFEHVFDLMSIQRNFKAIGSFASFLNRRGNATYLKFIGNTFENVRRTLLKYPRYSNLREVLFHYYYF